MRSAGSRLSPCCSRRQAHASVTSLRHRHTQRTRTMPQRPIELHYWPTPNGHKITIMLEECGLPYEVTYVNIMRGDQFKPGFLRIAPNNRMPAIVDPEGPGGEPISVFESGAILQ